MRIKDFLKERTAIVGLDIREDIIQAVSSGKAASIATPPGAVKDGLIIAPDKIARVLRELRIKNKIKSKNVSLAIHGPDLLLHVITIPYARDEAVLSILESKVNQYVAFAGVKTVIGWEKLGEESSAGEKKMRVLLAAAKRELVDSYISAVEKAGLVINAIAFPSLAALRALLGSSLKSRPKEKKIFVYVDGKQTFIHILEGGAMVFIHEGSLDGLTADLQKILHAHPEVIGDPIQLGPESSKIAEGLASAPLPKINLLPEEVKNAAEWRAQVAYFLMAVSGLALFMLALFFMLYLGGFVISSQIDRVRGELDKPSEQFVQLKEMEDKTEETKRLTAGRQRIIDKLNSFPWDDIFNEFVRIVPPNLYLNRVEINQEEAMIVSGVTKKSDYIYDFISKLKASKYFKNVDLRMVKEAEEKGQMISFSVYVEKK